MIHYQTSQEFMCIPACIMMLTDGVHGIDEIADLLDFQPGGGTNRWHLRRLEHWGYKVKMGMASEARLRNWLESGILPILQVALMGLNGEPHAIVLGGLNGDVATIHDPNHPGPFDLPLASLLSCWELLGRFAATIVPGKASTGRKDEGLGDTGFIYNAQGNPKDVYSLAPEYQTNFGRIEKVTGILLSGNTIAAAQAEGNALAGLYRAWKNIRFPHILVHARNMRFLEPATLDYFAVNLDPADTLREYDWEGKEFLTTEVSYEIDQENGHILVDVTGEASTWGPDGVAGLYPEGPPPDDPPADNPSEYWPAAWPPQTDGVDDPPPWADEDDGFPAALSVLYFVDRTSGRVFRCTNIETVPFYEDLGVVSAGGLKWIALDEFDKENRAMVCGNTGVWMTTNLSDPIPDWVFVLPPPAGWVFDMVRSSPLQQDLWAISGMKIGATGSIGIWWTETAGPPFSNHQNLRCGSFGTYASTYLELSTHNAEAMWVNWWLYDGAWAYSTHTPDLWASRSCDILPNAFKPNLVNESRVCSHHPNVGNEDDQIAVWAAGLLRTNNRAFRCTTDTGGCAGFVDLCTGTTLLGVKDIGCFGGRWWLLTRCDGGTPLFFISNNGFTWTEVHEFAGVVDHVAGWSAVRFVATHDGNVYPLLLSINRGTSWTQKPGNWADLGHTGNIQCVAIAY